MDKGESTPDDIEKLKKLVPKSYQKYIESEFEINQIIDYELMVSCIYSVP